MGSLTNPVILKGLEASVIRTLFNQALIGNYKGEPYEDVLARYTALVVAELQAQLLNAAHQRDNSWVRRTKRADRLTSEERSEAQRRGQQARRLREAGDQQGASR